VKPEKNFDFSETKIHEFCSRWKIRELAVFGSVLRDDFTPNSDIDVLVSFFEDAQWGLFEFVDMKGELEIIFGRKVDLIEKEGLKNPFRKKEILESCKVIYAA
jgi:predicted nucleotidyltransferase